MWPRIREGPALSGNFLSRLLHPFFPGSISSAENQREVFFFYFILFLFFLGGRGGGGIGFVFCAFVNFAHWIFPIKVDFHCRVNCTCVQT